MAAMVPLGLLSATDVGLAKLDARVGATATSTHIGAKCLTAWLRRVTDTWETQCIRFRQLGGARPSLGECVQRHDVYLSTRTQAAALKAVIRSGRSEKRGPSAYGSPEVYAGGAGAVKRLSASKTSRGGRKQRSRVEAESEGSSSGAEEAERRPKKQAGQCAWPDKPRLADEKFKE